MESSSDGSMHYGKGKHLRDSNVTVIHVLHDRVNRRIDKIAARRRMDDEPVAESSDIESVLTITPFVRDGIKTSDGQFMKLHIINVRTGKIQDAIMLTTSNNHHHTNDFDSSKSKAFNRTPSKMGKRLDKNLLCVNLSFITRSNFIATSRNDQRI
jgi:hypothetical protein